MNLLTALSNYFGYYSQPLPETPQPLQEPVYEFNHGTTQNGLIIVEPQREHFSSRPKALFDNIPNYDNTDLFTEKTPAAASSSKLHSSTLPSSISSTIISLPEGTLSVINERQTSEPVTGLLVPKPLQRQLSASEIAATVQPICISCLSPATNKKGAEALLHTSITISNASTSRGIDEKLDRYEKMFLDTLHQFVASQKRKIFSSNRKSNYAQIEQAAPEHRAELYYQQAQFQKEKGNFAEAIFILDKASKYPNSEKARLLTAIIKAFEIQPPQYNEAYSIISELLDKNRNNVVLTLQCIEARETMLKKMIHDVTFNRELPLPEVCILAISDGIKGAKHNYKIIAFEKLAAKNNSILHLYSGCIKIIIDTFEREFLNTREYYISLENLYLSLIHAYEHEKEPMILISEAKEKAHECFKRQVFLRIN